MKRQFYLKQQTFTKNNLTMPGTATVVWYRSGVKALTELLPVPTRSRAYLG